MTLEDVSLIGQIVAAVTVVASLVFVGIQLRQNTKSVRSATSIAVTDLTIQLGSFVTGSDSGAQVWRMGLQGLDKLTENERARFTAFLSTLIRFFEATRVQWLRGQLDKEHWHNVEHQAMGLAVQPGVKAWWQVRAIGTRPSSANGSNPSKVFPEILDSTPPKRLTIPNEGHNWGKRTKQE